MNRCSPVLAQTATHAVLTETWYFGRYRVDLPAGARLVSSSNFYFAGAITCSSGSEAGFAADMAFRQKTLKARKSNYRWQSTQLLDLPDQRILVAHDAQAVAEQFLLEAYKQVGNQLFATSGITHGSRALPASVAYYTRFLNQLDYRAPHQAPAVAGFCFDHGLVGHTGDISQREQISMQFVLPEYPDVLITLGSEVLFGPQSSIVTQHDLALRNQKSWAPFETLRYGTLGRTDLQAEEVLLWQPDSMSGDSFGHRFNWQSRAVLGSVLDACVSLQLRSGEGRRGRLGHCTSLSDAQAVALFDQISASIRLQGNA